ncbi:MAG: DUF4384 domain-containing protein [Syntrophobacteraceae bacterium]|nr:DUF4384 domain-containing protein [Syntrophobacteraceae bacterium]
MRSEQALSPMAAPLFVLLISILFFQPCAWGAQKNRSDPEILWAFAAMRSHSPHPRAEPVTSGMALSSGDKLKMMIRMKNKCFVYLIHKDSQGNFTMLFPYSPQQADSAYRRDRNYFVPEGEAWFELDNRTGKETFYLIASDQRLLDIEYTYKKYVSCKETKGKLDLGEEMLSELGAITQRRFASSGRAGLSAGRGLARGFERAAGADPTDITGLARKISFNNIYSQTFVIDHK